MGELKANVDGAFNPKMGEAGLGVIIRDHEGKPLLMAWRVIWFCRSAEEAEATACLDGVRLGERWPEKRLILETDSATVVAKLKSDQPDRSWWLRSLRIRNEKGA